MKVINKIVKYKDGTVWFMYSDSDLAVYYASIDYFIQSIIKEKVDVKLTAL